MNAWFENIGLMNFTPLTIAVRLVLAVVCSFALGLERTRKRRPAGLRTYMLVCLGAAITMLTSEFLSQYYFDHDITRMSAQVISGIGFLGAGTIMVTRYYRVKGLTTAAGLWCAACLGTAVGAGFYLGSIAVCLILVFIMSFADRFEYAYTRKLRRLNLYIILEDVTKIPRFVQKMKDTQIALSDVETAKADGGHGIGLFCQLRFPAHMSEAETIQAVEESEGVLIAEPIEG
ncbi:MAG: MgtC/SapB family protein [Clostridiales bacterium]|nr:MgtC/SapB family protein [Clostridiales bacterium]